MKMLLAALIALGALLSPGTASIGTAAPQSPVVYQVPGITVVITSGSKPLRLLASPATTYLDQQFTYDCLSAAGCAVSATAKVQKLEAKAESLCAYVDGTPMPPACSDPSSNFEVDNSQGQLIGQGTHTLQTGINSLENGAPRYKVCPCTITYTIYDNGK